MTAIHPRPEGRGFLACDSVKSIEEPRVADTSTRIALDTTPEFVDRDQLDVAHGYLTGIADEV